MAARSRQPSSPWRPVPGSREGGTDHHLATPISLTTGATGTRDPDERLFRPLGPRSREVPVVAQDKDGLTHSRVHVTRCEEGREVGPVSRPISEADREPGRQRAVDRGQARVSRNRCTDADRRQTSSLTRERPGAGSSREESAVPPRPVPRGRSWTPQSDGLGRPGGRPMDAGRPGRTAHGGRHKEPPDGLAWLALLDELREALGLIDGGD